MARNVVRRFSRGARRPTDWSASAVLTAWQAVAASTVTLLETFTPIVGGETVIRTRGFLAISPDQNATNEQQVGAFGICVVTAQAESVGITAIPHPDTDAAWGGWLYHTYFACQMRVGDSTGFISPSGISWAIDSKAMRKVDEDERLVVVIENSAGFGLQVYNSERFLTKVH